MSEHLRLRFLKYSAVGEATLQYSNDGVVWLDVPTVECEPPIREEVDLEEFKPTVRCPVCYTYGHKHRKTRAFAGKGMENHVRIES